MGVANIPRTFCFPKGVVFSVRSGISQKVCSLRAVTCLRWGSLCSGVRPLFPGALPLIESSSDTFRLTVQLSGRVIATCRVFSLSQRAAGAGEEPYPTEGAPEPPLWRSGPLMAKVLGECTSQSGGCHRHPRGMSIRDCPAGELPSRMLGAVGALVGTRGCWLPR